MKSLLSLLIVLQCARVWNGITQMVLLRMMMSLVSWSRPGRIHLPALFVIRHVVRKFSDCLQSMKVLS